MTEDFPFKKLDVVLHVITIITYYEKKNNSRAFFWTRVRKKKTRAFFFLKGLTFTREPT